MWASVDARLQKASLSPFTFSVDTVSPCNEVPIEHTFWVFVTAHTPTLLLLTWRGGKKGGWSYQVACTGSGSLSILFVDTIQLTRFFTSPKGAGLREHPCPHTPRNRNRDPYVCVPTDIIVHDMNSCEPCAACGRFSEPVRVCRRVRW